MTTEKAILAGGCFWGIQDLIRKLPGVLSTRVGYTGGDAPNPTYRNHAGHAEAIEVIFDPDTISYRDLLEFFEPGGYDQVIFRGDVQRREFIAFWLARGRVLAGMNVNIWDVNDTIQAIVRSGRTVDADRLANPDVPLEQFVRD